MVLDPKNPKHAHALELLGKEIPIWLTTVNAEGQPQSSPVWFWWDGKVFHLFSKPDSPKVENMRGNQRVSLNLQASETADDDVVIFEGVAEFDPWPPDPAWFEPFRAKYRPLVESYGWSDEDVAEYSVVFHVTPTRVRVY